jgi:outer membrane protein OmpA-like peptidoglycan-associated protein
MKATNFKIIVSAGLLVASVGCSTVDPYTGEKQTSKAAIGAGVGAVGGALIGAMTGDRKSAMIGAGIGALAGGGAGYYMDVQEAKLKQRLQGTGVSVTRSGDNLILNMPGNVTFASDNADINSGFYQVLDSVVLVFKEYESTMIDVIGHTDSTGSAQYNQLLSERRASSVADYFRSRGVKAQRLLVSGAGETQPITSNDTKEGRMQNRRVEIRLTPLKR